MTQVRASINKAICWLVGHDAADPVPSTAPDGTPILTIDCKRCSPKAGSVGATKPMAKTHDQPKIGRIHVVHAPCAVCGGPLVDGDVIVWWDRADGSRSDRSHAYCVVMIRKADGVIVRLSGQVVPSGILEETKPGHVLLLTEAEWSDWLDRCAAATVEQADAQPASPCELAERK